MQALFTKMQQDADRTDLVDQHLSDALQDPDRAQDNCSGSMQSSQCMTRACVAARTVSEMTLV